MKSTENNNSWEGKRNDESEPEELPGFPRVLPTRYGKRCSSIKGKCQFAISKKDRELEPILILLTDGRANAVGKNDKDPVESALNMAQKFNKANITSVVIDTENDFIKLGLAKKVATQMGANYYSLTQLSQDQILRIVRNTQS